MRKGNINIEFEPYHGQELERGDQIKMWFSPDHKKVTADVLYKVREGVWKVWIKTKGVNGEYMVDKSLVHAVSKTMHESLQYSEQMQEHLKKVYPYYEAII